MKRFELILLQGAQSDLLQIYSERGERAYLRVDRSLGILRIFPESGAIHLDERIRRLVVAKTPLGVFYTVTEDRVLIGAVLDLRQSTKAIRKRLREL